MKILGQNKTLSPEDLKALQIKGAQSKMFYYSLAYANDVKKLFDQLESTKLPMRAYEGQFTVSSLKVQYYQAVKYLLDHLDPDGHYAALKARVRCVAHEGYIEWNLRPQRGLAEVVTINPWKERFDDFLENAKPNDKLHIQNIDLKEEELDYIHSQLASLFKTINGEQVPLFYGEIKKDSLLLIRDEN